MTIIEALQAMRDGKAVRPGGFVGYQFSIRNERLLVVSHNCWPREFDFTENSFSIREIDADWEIVPENERWDREEDR